MKAEFNSKEVDRDKIHFQYEIKCTRERIEEILGCPASESVSPDIDWIWTGELTLQYGRILPIMIHNWKPNCRDRDDEFFWHIYAPYYDDFHILDDIFGIKISRY